jgi:hypothetical protein
MVEKWIRYSSTECHYRMTKIMSHEIKKLENSRKNQIKFVK